MEATSEPASDKGLGYSVLFGLLVAASSLVLAALPGRGPLGAIAFAVAMTAGFALVVAAHVYE